jgi:hypothetical protein
LMNVAIKQVRLRRTLLTGDKPFLDHFLSQVNCTIVRTETLRLRRPHHSQREL